jgi:hypothetical protein
MRRLLEANNYSIYVPSITLITCLFMNSSQENNSNMDIQNDDNGVQRRSNLKPDYI